MALTDLQIGAVCGAIALPWLIWNTVAAWWKGLIVWTDDGGKVTSQASRATQPVKFWLGITFNFALIIAFLVMIGLALSNHVG
jgi:hypothetical protein